MLQYLRRHLTYANVMATIAVFVAIGGTATAGTMFVVNSNADVAPGTISGAKPPSGDHSNIIGSSIAAADLANNAVNSGKVKDGSLTAADVASDTLTGTQIDESSLGTVPDATDASSLGGSPPSAFQARVTGTCSAGGAIGSIGSTGLVSCNNNAVRPGTGGLNLGGLSLGAHLCAKVDNVPYGPVAVGDTVIMVPDAATWPAGLIYMPLRSDKAGTIAFDLCNPTNATVASPSLPISLWAVKLTP